MNDIDNQKIEDRIQKLEQEIETIKTFKPIKLSELMAVEFKEAEWVVEQLIPAQGIIAISGAPASYKTWLVWDLVLKVANGDILFDKFTSSQIGVLVIDEENNQQLLQKRIHKLNKTFELPIHLLTFEGFKLSKESVAHIIKFAKQNSVKLVVFDSLVRIHSGNENDAMDMSNVFNLLRKLTKEGMTVIFTHHNRKQGFMRSNASQEMRGSSDILASVDCHIAIDRKPKEEFITLSQTKLRQKEEARPFKLNVVKSEQEFKFEFAGDVDEAQSTKSDFKDAIFDMLESEEKPMFKKELFEALKKSGLKGGKSTFKTAIEEMVKEGILFEQKAEKNKVLVSIKPFEVKFDELDGFVEAVKMPLTI